MSSRRTSTTSANRLICDEFPSDPTKLKADHLFSGNEHVDWNGSRQQAHARFAEADYPFGMVERGVSCCDWKVELEEACDALYLFSEEKLTDPQDGLDAATDMSNTKFHDFQTHINNIGKSTNCDEFPNDPTKLKADHFFAGSEYVDRYSSRQQSKPTPHMQRIIQ